MRRFLYYNEDSINSFLAQLQKGLIQRHQSETEKGNSSSKTEDLQATVTGDLSAKLFGLGAALKGEMKSASSESAILSELNKNIHEKILHDFAFEMVFEYLQENKLIRNDDLAIGDIVLTKEVPTFLDFGYIQGLFAPNGIYKMASEQSRKEMEAHLNELKQEMPKGAQIPQNIRTQMKHMENEVKNAGKYSENERKELERSFEAIKSVLPYKRFIMTDKFLIPLLDDYFRDDPNIVSFKYGGKISVLGYITNVIKEDTETEHHNDISPLFEMLNLVMLKLFKSKTEVFIIHPIALYY